MPWNSCVRLATDFPLLVFVDKRKWVVDYGQNEEKKRKENGKYFSFFVSIFMFNTLNMIRCNGRSASIVLCLPLTSTHWWSNCYSYIAHTDLFLCCWFSRQRCLSLILLKVFLICFLAFSLLVCFKLRKKDRHIEQTFVYLLACFLIDMLWLCLVY